MTPEHIQELAGRALACFRKGELSAVAGELAISRALVTLREIRDHRTKLPKPEKKIGPIPLRKK